MNRFDKMALASVVAMTFLCARGQLRIAHLYIDMDHLSRTMIVIWAIGWVIATYGPIAIAAWFWRWAKRARAPGVLHLLLLPCVIMAFRTGESLMLFTIPEPDFDATLDGPVMPAMLLFVVAVGGYFGALISKQIGRAGAHAEAP